MTCGRAGSCGGTLPEPRERQSGWRDRAAGSAVSPRRALDAAAVPPAWQNYLHGERHDHRAATVIRSGGVDGGETFIGFGNQSWHSFAAARQHGFKTRVLVAATSHVLNVRRRHEDALRDYPLDSPWMNNAQVQKSLREYDDADMIIAASEYTRQSMIEHGVTASKLLRFRYTADPRFQPPGYDRFRIVYCGSVTPMKGVPVLIEAFRRFTSPHAELGIVGGTSNRAMRRYMEAAIAAERRIRMASGDLLPVLHGAHAYVHPSYDDGFAYAPMEALACGVPVIVTEHTGMCEHVREGVNGFVVPTGRWQAILNRLEYLERHPLRVQPQSERGAGVVSSDRRRRILLLTLGGHGTGGFGVVSQ